MSKRFTDSEKYKNRFFRGLQGPYKLLWDYLYHDCNHAGIWIADFEIAQIYLGQDMPVNSSDALGFFNQGEERVVVVDGGGKWFIKPFVEFQYGELNPANKVHASVIKQISKYPELRTIPSPSQGSKDKEKEKVKDKKKEGYTVEFETWWAAYRKGSKANAFKRWEEKRKSGDLPEIGKLVEITNQYKAHCASNDRSLKDGEGWINGMFWEAEWVTKVSATVKSIEVY